MLPSSETHLLAYAAGTPVGNLRIAEAEACAARRAAVRGVAVDDVLTRSEAFVEFATALPWEAPSSVCLQGERPKFQLTMAADGLLYPDGSVPDADARQRYLVKLARSSAPRDGLILEIEALYARAAADLGLHVSEGYLSGAAVLMIPRFDREPSDGAIRWGQESLASAAGVAEFGHLGAHENYISLISDVSSDPRSDRFDLRRDFLNLCLGNDDNHGRNMALSKRDGSVRLSNIFDLAPMRLSGNAIARSTKWACRREAGSDYRPRWDVVASAVAQDDDEYHSLLGNLAAFAERLPAAAASIAARASDPQAAKHAMSRMDGLVRDVVSVAELNATGIGRGCALPD